MNTAGSRQRLLRIQKNLAVLQEQLRALAVRSVPGTTSAFAERVNGGSFLNIVPDRMRLAQYGVLIEDVQQAVSSALGGESVTTTVEGRERYGVNLRYPRDLRSDPQSIAREVLVEIGRASCRERV